MGIRCIRFDGDTVRLDAKIAGNTATCPACQTVSSRVHGRYVRRPIDLPMRGHPTRLDITVRSFFCENPTCKRSTFAEDCGQNLPRYARRTREVSRHLLQIVRVAGGEAGAGLAADDCLPVSPDTLLRLQRQAPPLVFPNPRVLGLDDLALRRGRTYATIFVDLETSRRIDMVEGRDSEMVAAWLKMHPGIEIISRDRGQDYAKGAKAGAPQAVQVADRFHLVQNASQALDGMMRGRRLNVDDEAEPESGETIADTEGNSQVETDRPIDPADESGWAIAASKGEMAAPTGEMPREGVELNVAPTQAISATRRILAERRTARLVRWERIQSLAKVGMSIRAIGREVDLSRKTVRHLINSPEPPRNQRLQPRPGGLESPTLQPYLPYLQSRWRDGCANVAQLFRELVERGYRGSRSLLAQSLQPWRGPRSPRSERSKKKRLTRRSSLRWFCLRPPNQLEPEERDLLDKLLARDTQLALGYSLLQRFREIVSTRDLAKLDIWLNDAKSSNLPSFISLANGLNDDRAAVVAALTISWSNGPVEGHITKIKLIKRQGYGRANFDLLRIRVLSS